MMFNPEKNSPVKMDVKRIQQGLSKKQMRKIEYECDLLQVDVQKLVYIAPYLFNEGVTAANTSIVEDKINKEVEEPSIEDMYDDSDYYSSYGGL